MVNACEDFQENVQSLHSWATLNRRLELGSKRRQGHPGWAPRLVQPGGGKGINLKVKMNYGQTRSGGGIPRVGETPQEWNPSGDWLSGVTGSEKMDA